MGGSGSRGCVHRCACFGCKLTVPEGDRGWLAGGESLSLRGEGSEGRARGGGRGRGGGAREGQLGGLTPVAHALS